MRFFENWVALRFVKLLPICSLTGIAIRFAMASALYRIEVQLSGRAQRTVVAGSCVNQAEPG